MPTPLFEFRQFLNSQGKRLNRERMIVAAITFTLVSPFDAELVVEITSLLPGKDARISRAAVYRTLQLLSESGQITLKRQNNDVILCSHTYRGLRSPDAFASSLCQSTHRKMIAGTCPWCGGSILNSAGHNQ